MVAVLRANNFIEFSGQNRPREWCGFPTLENNFSAGAIGMWGEGEDLKSPTIAFREPASPNNLSSATAIFVRPFPVIRCNHESFREARRFLRFPTPGDYVFVTVFP